MKNDHVMATEGRRGNVESLSVMKSKASGFDSKVVHFIICVDMTVNELMAQDDVMVTVWVHDECVHVPYLSELNEAASISL